VAEGRPGDLAERSGSDVVRVHLDVPFAGDPARIVPGTAWAAEASEDGHVLTVRGGRGGEMASRVLEHLVHQQVRVENVEIRRQRLEDAFVEITGRRIDDTGGAAPVDPRRRDV
jgi:hypothetical protein